MVKNTLEVFIKHCGTVKKAGNILRTTHQNVSSMRNGRTWVSHKFARRISDYLWEQMSYKVNPLDLVSPMERSELKLSSLPITYSPIKLKNISIIQVKSDFLKADLINKNQTPLNQLRPIILDENQQLIANANTYLLYKQQGKKTVPAWQISLPDLLARKYLPSLLEQTFLLFERTAIGIAAKKYLGNRQGPRNYKRFRRNFDEIEGRTDELLASLLQFGSKDSYRQTEKIYLLGCDQLIRFVNEGKLKISTAAQLIRFSRRKQQKILIRNKKQILAFIYQSKKRK